MHGIQWLADVDIEVGVGVRGVILLTFIVRFIATGAVDERGQVNDGAPVPHSAFRLFKGEDCI